MFSEFRRECRKLTSDYDFIELEEPPKGIADLALPCFLLSKKMKKSPQEIAKEIASQIRIPSGSLVGKAEASGPYVNFFINYDEFFLPVIENALQDRYGAGKKKHEKVVIESPGPNTNKPLHLGHLRNMSLGISLSNILEFDGYDVIRADIINDRGIHICKSMLAYDKLGKGSKPEKKSDHFIGDFYVKFAQELEGKEGTEEELREMLVNWENGDKKVRDLWKKMNKWAIDGIHETYQRFGVKIDRAYFESDHYLKGKQLAQDGLKKGIFKKDDEGNVIADIENLGLGKRVLLRPDGTTLYITQDMALASVRFSELKMDKMIYVVASEQSEHFKALFAILDMLRYPFARNCHHLSYGMVNLPEGKMKSREGKVVDADDLMDEMHAMAEDEIRKRDVDISKKELDSRSEKIGLSAIKYFILKFDIARTITYDPKESLDFEGDTGPYLLYTYARCCSILRKSGSKPQAGQLGDSERLLAKKISIFPEIVRHASQEYKPSIIAAYAFELASVFNEYYHSTKVINSEREKERLALVLACSKVLKNCLGMLGIDALEKM
jgi:arginyl-tRNA synthetase